MNSVSEITETTTGKGIVMEAQGSHPQSSGGRETVNISVDFFKNMKRTSVPSKKRLTSKRKEIIQHFFSKTYPREEVQQRYGAIEPSNQRVLELIKETLNRKTTRKASKVTQLDIRDWIENYRWFFKEAEKKGREEYNRIIKEDLYGKTTKRASKLTQLDIRNWIVKTPRFLNTAEEKGSEEYNLRKEAEARCSEQEVASGSAAVVEEAQPMNMEVAAQANQAYRLSPLSDQEKLALMGLLVGVTSQSDTLGNFLQWLNMKAVNQQVRNEEAEETVDG